MPRKAIVISSPPTVVVPLSSPPPPPPPTTAAAAAQLPPFLLRADAPGRMLTRRFLKEMEEEEAPGATANVASQVSSTTAAAVATTSGNTTLSSSLTIISSRPARNVGGRSGSNTTTPNTSSSTPPTISMRGGFRCICRSFLLSHSDEMMECIECKNWSHAACMEVDPLTIKKAARRTFVCFFCTGEAAKRQARRIEEGRLAPPPPPKHSVVLKLTECPDVVPSTNGKELDASLRRLVEYVASIGFEFIFVGKPSPSSSTSSAHHHHHSDSSNAFTDSFMEQSLACCASAIHSATFSETYPSWCLSELRSPPHGYLQGTFMRCIKTRRVVSLVLSNGMDGYGGLRSAVSRLRMIHTKAVNKGDVSWMEGHNEGQASSSSSSTPSGPSFVELCLGINDVSPFVHINLIATHPNYRPHDSHKSGEQGRCQLDGGAQRGAGIIIIVINTIGAIVCRVVPWH
ncbi:Hypothetical protein, putative [Bodo saltans]|uniref:Zinc finger PHD-type domain-containing protein n=1 Tax=Bodo saltans TaxID=75058 RepID=A0A0S4JH39_BODSA|nr:Hypothetical protein, putative [Bodo saltans]|eukprot:CUG88554.1 Hypothetical protein, putative [Bodo saltans]